MTQRQLSVDTNKCIGAGQCIILAAEYFGQDEEGYVEVESDRSMADLADEELVIDAVHNCPSGALSWRTA